MRLKQGELPPKSLRTGQRFRGNNKTTRRHNRRFFKSHLVITSNISTANNALGILAINLIADCYHPQKTSKELIRTLIIGIEQIRSSDYDA